MTSTSTSTRTELHEALDGEHRVLAGRPLRPGVVLAETSRFADDLWRLEHGLLQQHVKTLALNFATVPERYRLHAKQLCYAMLAGPLPPGERRQSLLSIRRVFSELSRFLHWLDTRPPAAEQAAQPDLATLTGGDLTDYHRHLLALPSVSAREHARRAVRLFWRYRTGLADPLLIDPITSTAGHTASVPRRTRPTASPNSSSGH